VAGLALGSFRDPLWRWERSPKALDSPREHNYSKARSRCAKAAQALADSALGCLP